MTSQNLKERNFENAIVRDFLDAGYSQGDPKQFDAGIALFPDELFAFLEASQPSVWAELSKNHGAQLRPAILDELQKTLASRGTLDVLRRGFKFYGKTLHAAYFRPAHGLNPDVIERYQKNRLTITRQVYFDPKSNDSVDMVISLNGLPVATLELKNSLTGQTVIHAQKQYRDRDPRCPLFWFQKRALVHFAVDTDQVYMTTHLDGSGTRFLPFNQGDRGGAGNPSPPGGGYKSAYLWREILTRDSLLDILQRFMFVETEERTEKGKRTKHERLVFPRYHQLDAVRGLEDAARAEGPGNHYLIQHSAGSGKTNSIAWLAYRLQALHDAQDRKVFDSVVIVTDRRILDRQLRDAIHQMEHKDGVVAAIDKSSAQLAEALETGTPIIITTLQKFPFVTERISALPQRNCAIIADEAHSSQSGEAAQSLRRVLTGVNPRTGASRAADRGPAAQTDAQEPDDPTYEDEINEVMRSRGRQPNLSFFAFTATPKAKTLEVFGRPGPDGRPTPFHLYSMRQAIEEGFILDVLRGYATYKIYYKLVQQAAEDQTVPKQEAVRALARFMSLHPHNIAQKVEVMIEHFRTHVRGRLAGRAKAMVVTRSRLHAVRYKLAFDAYIAEKGYRDLATLVAFSGTITDLDTLQSHTEVAMNNGLSETQLRDEFATDAYQVLIVANKYQTGFDQPLLCAMYVDKKLSGVQAVQTLSRLNRTYPGKDATFVLDFANDTEEILAAFQPFYEQTTVAEITDWHQLYDLQHKLDNGRIWTDEELESFARVFYKPKAKLTAKEHEEVHRYLDPARDRWSQWDDEDARDQWRRQLEAFVRLYSFLSQILPFTDRDLEIRYSFGRLLLTRLPSDHRDPIDLTGDVALEYYRLARTGERDIVLARDEVGEVRGPSAVGTGKSQDEDAALSDIIETLNKRFGTEFQPGDRLFMEQTIADCKADEQVRQRAQANDYENFALSMAPTLQDQMIDRLDRNQELVSKYLNEDEFRRVIFDFITRRIYDDVRREAG
jgi:type I restriction enzyme R subunit